MFSKILVAYDGTEIGNRALDHAIKLAEMDDNIVLHLVHVIDLPIITNQFSYFPTVYVETNIQELRLGIMKEAEKLMRNAEGRLAFIPNSTSSFILEGQPGETLLQHAKDHNCDLIIMGSNGKGAMKELFLGSVSHYVTQHSPVPVFIVK